MDRCRELKERERIYNAGISGHRKSIAMKQKLIENKRKAPIPKAEREGLISQLERYIAEDERHIAENERKIAETRREADEEGCN